MFGRVLFPTDFSAYANTVFACLPDLQAGGMGEVVLLSVIRTADVPMPETINRESMEFVRWSAEEKLNIARMALEGRGLRVVTRVEYGSPVSNIVRVAEEEGVDMIVMGAQGKSLTEELLLGSTTNGVLRRATVPLLIEKVEVVRELGRVECRRVCAHTFENVLFPTDFSDCAHAAFNVVKRMKGAGVQHVAILHVLDERVLRQRSDEQIADFTQEAERQLETLQRALTLYGLPADTVLRRGMPVTEILKAAGEKDSCLIVLGSHGRSALQEILIGSTSENVVRLSRHPVLVVRTE